MNKPITRRHFAAGCLCAAATVAHSNRLMWTVGQSRFGLQLHTVRDLLTEDLPGTFKAIKDIGYNRVELMAVKDAREHTNVARDHGLYVSSSFIDWRSICNPTADKTRDFDLILEEAEETHLNYIVLGYLGKEFRKTEDDYKRVAEQMNAAGEKSAESKLQLCYHNMSHEFKPFKGTTRCGFDVLVEHFDPDLVKFELDTFGLHIGGKDPEKVIRELEGRVAQIHLKDLREGCPTIYDEMQIPGLAYKELGAGVIDIKGAALAAANTRVVHFYVEQEHSPDPLTSIRKSLAYLI